MPRHSCSRLPRTLRAPSAILLADTLTVAASPLPQVNGFSVCASYRFGDRDIENLQVPDAAICVLEAGVRIDGSVELGTASESTHGA